MKKLLAFIMLSIFIVLLCGCESKLQDKNIEFSVEIHIDETVNNGDHKRNVKIARLESNSEHTVKINEEICLKFEKVYNDYLENRDFFYEGLVIDYTYHVENDILSITAIADVPSEITQPLISSSIYLDLKKDVLYSPEEYASILEIDTQKIINDLGNTYFGSYPPKLGGIFHHKNDVMLVFDTKEISLWGHSFFYNQTKGTFGQVEALHFPGFFDLKISSKELITYVQSYKEVPYSVKLVKNTISFKNKTGQCKPEYFTEFLTKYGEGIFGNVEIKKILVEEAIIDVFTEIKSGSSTDKSLYATAVTAFGHTYVLEHPVELGRLTGNIVYFDGDYFVFSDNQAKTVIITEKGAECFENTYDENDLVTEFFIEYDGSLAYIKRPYNYPIDYKDQPERILKNCKGKDDFCREYGKIKITDGDVEFIPEKILIVSETYDLEGLLAELYSSYDVATANSRLFVSSASKLSLDELLAYNIQRSNADVKE